MALRPCGSPLWQTVGGDRFLKFPPRKNNISGGGDAGVLHEIIRAQAPMISSRYMAVMRAYAGLHPDQTRRHIREPYRHLIAPPFLTPPNCAALVRADNV